jgi:hypothetical protein
MKNLTLSNQKRVMILCIIFMGLYAAVNASNPKMDAKLYNPTFSGSGASTKYTVTLAIKSDTTGENLGNAVFIFTYNSTDLSYPSSPVSGTDYSFLHFSGSAYGTASVTNSGGGVLSVHITLPYGNTGTSISSGFVDVCTITFSIVNVGTGTNSNLTWSMTESSPPAMDDVFDDASASGFVTYNNFDDSLFTGLNTTPLPIDLLNFTASMKGPVAELRWSTATETNNAFFTVERSADGKDFMPILQKPGGGSSLTRLDYFAVDDQPLPGRSYYRLSQTDYNGKTTTFNIVVVQNTFADVIVVRSAGPVPFSNSACIAYSIPFEGAVRITMTNSLGDRIRSYQSHAVKGNNIFNISDGASFKPGIYYLNFEYGGNWKSIKLIKN